MANVDPQGQQKPSTAEGSQPVANLPLNALDVNRLFKGKADKGKNKPSQTKKPPAGKTQNPNQGRSGQPGRPTQR